MLIFHSDTDSLLFGVETEDIYRDVKEMGEHFDFSNIESTPKLEGYPSFLHDMSNKRVPGKFKDEASGYAIRSFCGLRSKLYSTIIEKDDGPLQKGATAGTKRRVAKRLLTHEEFVKVVTRKKKYMYVEQSTIRSDKHQLQTITQHRCALSGVDDKRYILPDGRTRAIGHWLNDFTEGDGYIEDDDESW